ncbi:M23 family metallopeptidase [Streptomyces sp. NPDC050560]|uniref:M23 family metallopeptidase n=1 Tax=Streptomyces sp. NPDC050560 TaxID=3365630 RepID=UPI0037B4B2D0
MTTTSRLRLLLRRSPAASLAREAVRAAARTSTARRAATCVLGLAAALAVGAAAAAAGMARAAQEPAPGDAPPAPPPASAPPSGPTAPHASSFQTGDGGRRPLRRPAAARKSKRVRSPRARSAAREPSPQTGVTSVPPLARAWPVDQLPQVLRGWEPPATPYGPGHRGVDVAAGVGEPVRAVAAGTVSFAGRVAGRGVVAIELDGTGGPPLRTTYEPVLPTVRKGDRVRPGQQVGLLERGRHRCSAPCLHWGLRRGKAYLDPMSLLPPWLLPAGPSRLLPVAGVPAGG